MALLSLTFLSVVIAYAYAAPTNEAQLADKEALGAPQDSNLKDDLNAAASNNYNRRFSDWGVNPSGYSGYSTGVTGYGLVDDRYNNYNTYQGGIGGYDNSFGYGGYNSGYSGSGYNGNTGYSGFNKGYGYGTSGISGIGSYGGNGGYGGYGGNGGLTSYYGYNNPYNQGAYHLGYGYYNKRPGYGSIYNSGVTPSLVTGYRGYTR